MEISKKILENNEEIWWKSLEKSRDQCKFCEMFKRGGVSTVRRIQLKNEPSDKIPIFTQSKGIEAATGGVL